MSGWTAARSTKVLMFSAEDLPDIGPCPPWLGGYWEADSDVGRGVKFAGVTHWVEFPEPLHQIAPLSAEYRPGGGP